MKSSALFERGSLPPYIHFASTRHLHVIGVPRPSPFLALFRFVYYSECKLKNKNGGGLGMRLTHNNIHDKYCQEPEMMSVCYCRGSREEEKTCNFYSGRVKVEFPVNYKHHIQLSFS